MVRAVEPHVHRPAGADGDGEPRRLRPRLGVADLAAAREVDDAVPVGDVEYRHPDGAAGAADRRPRVEVAEDLVGALAGLPHPEGAVLGHAHAVAPALAVDHQHGNRGLGCGGRGQRDEHGDAGEEPPSHPPSLPHPHPTGTNPGPAELSDGSRRFPSQAIPRTGESSSRP